ncbi:hypothetical protein BDP27DRAFT_1232870 [Rhodocollybia butyracea]|uniref:Uncharacterized protein n=1 Tax=Rhodocollybia butyracea TaxID=206335 RepID=A0A9P5U2T0_9AGAR|nr:hypothetical protein BDP27DRAFT_1232870 [Rhodocollybia butyracea]
MLPDPESLTEANIGYFALRSREFGNRDFLEHEIWLCTLLSEIRMMQRGVDGNGDGDDASRLEDIVMDALVDLHHHKKRQWDEQADPLGAPIIDNRKLTIWLGRMLSVPSFEDAIQNHLSTSHSSGDDTQNNIRDSPVFNTIPRPDGQPFMSNDPGSQDLWLMFSLGVDGFHPFHQCTAHASITSTAIYMTCVSLPEHLRYKRENMFLVTVMNGKTHS